MIELLVLSIIVLCFAVVCFFGSPYIPTRKKWAEDALSLVELNKNDKFIDLGAGDGKILRMVADKGIKSVGYEINPLLIIMLKLRFLRTDIVDVKTKNYWRTNLPEDTTVVYAFMVDRDGAKLKEYISQQAKLVNTEKIKLITFGFSLPNLSPINKTEKSYLYIFE